MPQKLHPEVVDEIVSVIRRGFTPSQVHAEFPGVGKRTIERFTRNIRNFGVPYLPEGRHGCKPIITPEIEEGLSQLLAAKPTIYLDEIKWYLEENWGISPSETTIWRKLHQAGFRKKVTQRISNKRDPVEREEHYQFIRQFDEEDLVFTDEAGAHEGTLKRRTGWAPRGTPAVETSSTNRSKRWTILPAYAVDGYLEGTLVRHGSVTADLFLGWLETTVLPQMNPAPGPRSVLVLDNLKAHHDRVSFGICI